MSAIAEKPRKKRVSAFSHRKVDPAYYWMTVPAMILFMVFLYWPFLRGVMYPSPIPRATANTNGSA